MIVYAGESDLKKMTKKQLQLKIERMKTDEEYLKERIDSLKRENSDLLNFVEHCGPGESKFHYISRYGDLHRNGCGGLASEVLKEERKLKWLLGREKRKHILTGIVIFSVSFLLLGIFCQLLVNLSRGLT